MPVHCPTWFLFWPWFRFSMLQLWSDSVNSTVYIQKKSEIDCKDVQRQRVQKSGTLWEPSEQDCLGLTHEIFRCKPMATKNCSILRGNVVTSKKAWLALFFSDSKQKSNARWPNRFSWRCRSGDCCTHGACDPKEKPWELFTECEGSPAAAAKWKPVVKPTKLNARNIWGWVKTYYYHHFLCGINIHFRYHPGARVLTHSHMRTFLLGMSCWKSQRGCCCQMVGSQGTVWTWRWGSLQGDMCGHCLSDADTVETDFLIQPWTLFKPILQDSAFFLQDTPLKTVLWNTISGNTNCLHTLCFLLDRPNGNGTEHTPHRMGLYGAVGLLLVVVLLPRPWWMLRSSYWHHVWHMGMSENGVQTHNEIAI